jgi:hypothetical protein
MCTTLNIICYSFIHFHAPVLRTLIHHQLGWMSCLFISRLHFHDSVLCFPCRNSFFFPILSFLPVQDRLGWEPASWPQDWSLSEEGGSEPPHSGPKSLQALSTVTKTHSSVNQISKDSRQPSSRGYNVKPWQDFSKVKFSINGWQSCECLQKQRCLLP